VKQEVTSKRSFWPTLALMGLFLVVSLSCSVGQILAGRSASAVPTATKTPRPTFTPLPGVLTPLPTLDQAVRGVLPPGVTAAAPTLLADAFSPALDTGSGRTSLVLFATETPAPSPTPEPTDTPGPIPTPTPDIETNRPTRVAGPRPLPTPYVVVNSERLNGRRGPGTTFEIVGQVRRGDELMILARTPDGDWWQVCCIANQSAWVAADLVTARGPLDDVAVVVPPPTPVPTPPPLPTSTPPPPPTPAPPFDIARGPEFPFQRDTGVLTIWVKVYEGPTDNQQALVGYVLKVSRDGVDVSLPNQSYAPFGNTKPEGNYDYNLKFEMFNAGEADWRIYLANATGYRVSPISEFTTRGDSYRNLVVYIAYWLAR
jgi:uncharacterized protein YgiM (DUF1202 family)